MAKLKIGSREYWLDIFNGSREGSFAYRVAKEELDGDKCVQ